MRVLLYAPVDLNLIDGSAIWIASVAQMLCADERIRVDILQNNPITREVNVQPLREQERVRLVDPWQSRTEPALKGLRDGKLGPRLTPEQALRRIEALHRAAPYDLLILRGGPICEGVAQMPGLAARSWFYLTHHGADFATVNAIAHSNGRIACQTPLLQDFFEEMLGANPRRFVPLPPMVPGLRCEEPRSQRANRRLCYVGKFEPNYMVEEMLAGFRELRARFGDAEFVVAGDKFHDPKRTGEFRKRLESALRDTPGVDWRGGMTRAEVGALMAECAVGSCWRSDAYDDSRELSTKVLEYAAAGLPVLLNPTRINRQLFGDDYPLYVDTPASFVDRLGAVWEDEALYADASRMAFEAAQRYTFAAVNETLRPWLAEYDSRSIEVLEPRRPVHVVFAGHDLKFCRPIIDRIRSRPDTSVRIDAWRGHTLHNERESEQLAQWADVVWCEWCLGNAVWYSQRLRPAQRMLIRLHRQEVTTIYPNEVYWPNVDHLIFIAEHVRKTLLDGLGPGMVCDARLVYNVIDCDLLDQPKSDEAEFHLGMLGYCPKLKNPWLAAQILERLVREDARFRLLLTGRRPETYAWLWSRPEERTFYQAFESFIERHDLEPYLIRQDWTDDPPAWYRDVGFVLSCSELEGSHQAVAEGMAAGSLPVVRRWNGAAEMYPNSLLFNTAHEAAKGILDIVQSGRREALVAAARREARERFDCTVVLPQLERLIMGRAYEAAESTSRAAGSAGPAAAAEERRSRLSRPISDATARVPNSP